jgi:LuxR family maltose regulon positive regulatory protein
LILVSAPAGFGKTTLLCKWISVNKVQATWIALDSGDNEYRQFINYVVAALGKVDENIGKTTLPLLHSSQQIQNESLLTSLINEITESTRDFVLVLDDYHQIENKQIHESLEFLLEHLPPQMHMVIATREDPNLPLARLRARGQLTELRANDLRFSPSEAAEFLNSVMGLNLSSKDVQAIEERTEGWIAGLQLAAISMQGHSNDPGFIQSFTGSHHFILDYLLEEVLNQQSEHMQSFLLGTSILDRLCGPLCDAVLADSSGSGQKTLEYIQNANLFLVPLDSERRWYRYHHLFAELLRQRLQQTTTGSSEDDNMNIVELHLRASTWFGQNGFHNEAFHHAVSAGDYDRAAGLAERSWPAMDATFQSSTWLSWVKKLPDEMVRKRPVLSVGYAWALLDIGEMEGADQRLKDAERWIDIIVDTGQRPGEVVIEDEEQFQSIPATIANAHAYYAQSHGDIPATVKYTRQALDLLPEEDSRRGPATGLLGCAYWSTGDLEAAYETFTDCMAVLQKSGNILPALSTTIGLAAIRIEQGRLNDAVLEYERALQLISEHGGSVQPVTPDMYLGLSAICCEQGELELAVQNLQKSRELSEQAALPDWRHRWHLTNARILECQGDLDGALKELDKAERLFFKTPLPVLRPIAARKAQLWVKQAKLKNAVNWIRERGLTVNDDLNYLHEFEHITLTRILIAGYSTNSEDFPLEDAMEFLNRLLEAAENGGRRGSLIEILILKSLALEARSNTSDALEPLKQALTLAAPEKYIQIFADEDTPMLQLLSKAVAVERMPDFANTLMAAMQLRGKKKKDVSSQSPVPSDQPLAEPLSEREREVLHLISQGFSNNEISQKLYLALSTVKGHNQKIFDKLNVRRRTEAVARARQLWLL